MERHNVPTVFLAAGAALLLAMPACDPEPSDGGAVLTSTGTNSSGAADEGDVLPDTVSAGMQSGGDTGGGSSSTGDSPSTTGGVFDETTTGTDDGNDATDTGATTAQATTAGSDGSSDGTGTDTDDDEEPTGTTGSSTGTSDGDTEGDTVGTASDSGIGEFCSYLDEDACLFFDPCDWDDATKACVTAETP